MAERRRPVSNPLALAVLTCLRERPMHPYQMAATMRERGKERSIKLNYGSLYTVVDNLARHGFIEAVESRREGRRPERTVYHLTPAGRAELEDWMTELVSVPVKEYPQFEAALSELPVLAPEAVLALLSKRVSALEDAVRAGRAGLEAVAGLPRLFLLETEYHLAMREAELAWIRGLVAELDDGSFPGLAGWRHWQETGQLPADAADWLAGPGKDALAGQGGPDGPGGRDARPG